MRLLNGFADALPGGSARRPVLMLALGAFALGTDAFVISGVLGLFRLLKLTFVYPHQRRVIRRVGLRLGQPVGRHMRHLAVDRR